MLTALVAFAALDGVRTVWRVLGSVVVALPYMAAAYLAQEAFKEPILAFSCWPLRCCWGGRRVLGMRFRLGSSRLGRCTCTRSPGWLGWRGRRWCGRGSRRFAGSGLSGRRCIAGGIGVLALVVLVAPEIPRLLDFKDFRALDPDRANEGGLGNLGSRSRL